MGALSALGAEMLQNGVLEVFLRAFSACNSVWLFRFNCNPISLVQSVQLFKFRTEFQEILRFC